MDAFISSDLPYLDRCTAKDNSSRAEINQKPRESLKSGRNWLLLASGWMPERVQVPPDQSWASRSVVKSAGKPGNGSPKPDGSRMQALYWGPKNQFSWSYDSFRVAGSESRQSLETGRQ